jgi:hypothetical protein
MSSSNTCSNPSKLFDDSPQLSSALTRYKQLRNDNKTHEAAMQDSMVADAITAASIAHIKGDVLYGDHGKKLRSMYEHAFAMSHS